LQRPFFIPDICPILASLKVAGAYT
jgi:hypothetical protein